MAAWQALVKCSPTFSHGRPADESSWRGPSHAPSTSAPGLFAATVPVSTFPSDTPLLRENPQPRTGVQQTRLPLGWPHSTALSVSFDIPLSYQISGAHLGDLNLPGGIRRAPPLLVSVLPSQGPITGPISPGLSSRPSPCVTTSHPPSASFTAVLENTTFIFSPC